MTYASFSAGDLAASSGVANVRPDSAPRVMFHASASGADAAVAAKNCRRSMFCPLISEFGFRRISSPDKDDSPAPAMEIVHDLMNQRGVLRRRFSHRQANR